MKRILSAIIILTLMLSLMPISVFAATDAIVYTEASVNKVSPGDPLTYSVYLAGTYDGYSLEFSKKQSGFTVESVIGEPGVYADELTDSWRLSVMGGLNKVNSAKTKLATVTVSVDADAVPGTKEIGFTNIAVSNDIGDRATYSTELANVVVISKITGTQTVSVTAPVRGATPQNTISAGTGYTGTIDWEGNPTKFAANTVYAANITLTAATGYIFDSNATGSVSGATVSNNSVSSDGSTLTFKATFPKTADKDAPTCVAPAGLTATYGQTLSDITLTNPAGNTAGTWTWAAPATSVGNVGTRTFKATFTPANTNDYATVENIDVSVTVNPKQITVTVDSIADQQYTGSQIKPTVTVKGDGKTLVLNTDYTVDYGTNKNVGANGGSVTVKAKSGSNYTFSNTTKNFNIVAKAGQVTISGNLNITYPNTVPNVTIDKHGSDGSVTVYYYTNEACTTGKTTTKPTNAGNYWAKAEMAAGTNYGSAVSNVLAFTISRANITPGVSITNWTYLGTASTPSVSGNTGDGAVTYQYKVKGAADSTYTATVPTKAGDYTIKATVAQTTNYNGASATADFKINPKNISGVTIDAIVDQTYTGNAITPKPSVKDGSTPLVENTDFTYSYENNTNAGTATVKVVGKGNYTGTASKTFTIIRKDLSITVSITGWTVGGTPNAPAVTGNLGNGAVTYQYKVKGAADSTYTATVPTAVGNYTVKATVAQTANYNGATATTDFAISTKAAQTITAENVTVTYGDSGKKVSATTNGNGTISYAVKIGADVVDVNSTTGALTIKKVGTATITITASETTSHAAATKDITVTVNAKKITAPAADTTVYTYNGNEQTYKITANDAYTVTGNKQTAANETGYTVTVALKDKVNYQWSDGSTEDQTYNFIIKKASVTAPAANNTTFTYTGKEQTYSLTANDAYTITGNKQTTANETGYTVTVALKDKVNRQWSDGTTDDKTYTFIIRKATITITAKNKSAYVNDAVPALSDSDYTVSGLVNNETLKTNPTIAYEATPDMTKEGSVKILVSGAVAPDGGNYNDIVYNSGTLSITKKSSGGIIFIPTYYNVTVNDTEGGSVVANEVSATENTTITLTVSADEGYTFESVKVVDIGGNEVTVSGSDDKYTFVMPASDVTVTATFKKIDTPVNPNPVDPDPVTPNPVEPDPADPDPVAPSFDDVAKDAYYFDAVEWAVKNGVTTGTSDTAFSPDMTCTRAQAVTFLWRAAGSPEPKSTEMPFEDVSIDSYYYDAVLWAVENGITNGTSATTFSPDADCTRAQIVTFLWRAQKSPVLGSGNHFNDVAADVYYVNAVLWAVENGITNGTSATVFSPDADCTRAQIVTFLYRAMGDEK